MRTYGLGEVSAGAYLLAVNIDDHISLFYACISSSTSFNYIGHIYACIYFKVQFFTERSIQFIVVDAHKGALYASKFLKVTHDLHHEIRRYGEAVALEGAAARWDGGIDPNKLASGVHQCTAWIPRIDCCICLKETFNSTLFVDNIDIAPFGWNDTCGNGAREIERIPHSEHPLAKAYIVRIGHSNLLQAFSLNLKECDIRRRVSAYKHSIVFVVIGRHYRNFFGILDHVIVGYDISVFA